MTNTPMSEREKALLEAARRIEEGFESVAGDYFGFEAEDIEFLRKSVAAYGPKTEPVPVIPAWEEFIEQHGPFWVYHNGSGAFRIDIGSVRVTKDEYERVRSLTAKAPD